MIRLTWVSLASSLGLLSPENNPPLFSESNNTLTCLLIELNLLGKDNQNLEPQHFKWGLVYSMELSVTYCLHAEFNFNSCCLTWTTLKFFSVIQPLISTSGNGHENMYLGNAVSFSVQIIKQLGFILSKF